MKSSLADRFPPSEKAPDFNLPGLPSWAYFPAISVVALLAHWMALSSAFYMDDFPHILENGAVLGGEWGETTNWRWLPYLLWAGTAKIFGLSPVAFHLLNLAVHVGASCAVFVAGREIFERAGFLKSSEMRRHAAFFGAVIFACHPLCTEVVNYARCLMIGLVTLFSVLAALYAVRFSQAPDWRCGAGLFAMVGLAAVSKDPGIFHAVSTVAIVGVALGDRDRLVSFLREDRFQGRARLLMIPVALILVLVVAWWLQRILGIAMGWKNLHFIHALTQARIFWDYVGLMFYPRMLCVDHYPSWSVGGFRDLEATVKAIAILLLSAAVAIGLFRRRIRVVALLLALVLAPLLLRFLYPVKELMVEYRIYPAMPWVALLAGTALAWLYGKQRLLGGAAVMVVVGAGVFLSQERSAVWRSVESIASDVHIKYPLNGRGITQLQGAAFRAGDYAQVIRLREDLVRAVAAAEAYNREQDGRRAYEGLRLHSNYCNAEQLVVYALADWKGPKEALKYADAT
ncbi:MAG: hypothetical protein ACC661_11540, partial [Verrucomicrobiales bacterium]